MLAEYRQIIEGRLAKQIARHSRAGQGTSLPRIVDLQIAQEIEGLKKKLEHEEDPQRAEVWQALIDWLPSLAKTLKTGRYKSD